MMELTELIKHPEQMDRDTLYELRSQLALYPYFQTARLLMLQNLYLLHDSKFDEELLRAAIYITDRRVLFQMIEAAHYKLSTLASDPKRQEGTSESRTMSLIESFLSSMPKGDEKESAKKAPRKPTPADAAIDYVAYLLESESEEERQQKEDIPQLIGQDLIDIFINNDKGKRVLNENPELKPQLDSDTENEGKEGEEGYFTETLARIYIKQGKYSKAMEIIKQLNLQYPQKNAYFADQIRFLEKLIINSNNKQK